MQAHNTKLQDCAALQVVCIFYLVLGFCWCCCCLVSQSGNVLQNNRVCSQQWHSVGVLNATAYAMVTSVYNWRA